MSDTQAKAPARFTYHHCWPEISAEDAAWVTAFWQSEGAIAEPQQAAERVRQVVMYACDSAGNIAGVCTAAPMTPPQLGQPVYFWRTFVGQAHRRTMLMKWLAKRSCALLGDYARANGWPCIGVLVELENARFGERGRRPVWWDPVFVYIGKSARGFDVRIHYFDGAPLKATQD